MNKKGLFTRSMNSDYSSKVLEIKKCNEGGRLGECVVYSCFKWQQVKNHTAMNGYLIES